MNIHWKFPSLFRDKEGAARAAVNSSYPEIYPTAWSNKINIKIIFPWVIHADVSKVKVIIKMLSMNSEYKCLLDVLQMLNYLKFGRKEK